MEKNTPCFFIFSVFSVAKYLAMLLKLYPPGHINYVLFNKSDVPRSFNAY
ncbi:MAG: hypothetical protein K0S32_4599 [Bacteroidetes bacterium]|jgi:hypothetical protein|nr:hypothetical protein [Bacteroidota bacterium]